MNTILTIEKYLELIDGYHKSENIYFRGQSKEYKTTPPSIARDSRYIKNEYQIYSDKIKNQQNGDFKDCNSPIEILSKMQHYNYPTRLVDLTISSLVALYFAVEDLENKHDSIVNMYIVDGHDWDSKEAKLLSLLPTIKQKTLENLCDKYYEQYSENLNINEAKILLEKPIFIKYTEILEKSNPRLYSQQGTFLICTNKVLDNIITDDFISLDSIKPEMSIVIPFEYKQNIKDALDKSYEINISKIYPEPHYGGEYIKNKYKSKKLIDLNSLYTIRKQEDVSVGLVNRASIYIVLKQSLSIECIKDIIRNLPKDNNDVIWIYVAKNNDDYITHNWILQAQWINPSLNKKYIPLKFKETDDNEYFYEYSPDFTILAEHYLNNLFKDEKSILIEYYDLLKKLNPLFQNILEASNSNQQDVLQSLIMENKNMITEVYSNSDKLDYSCNEDFNNYTKLYDSFFRTFDDLHYLYENHHISEKALSYQLDKNISKMKSLFYDINKYYSKWTNVSQSEILNSYEKSML